MSRLGGGLGALSFPLVLIVLAIGAGFGSGGDMTDPATSFLGALLFVVAAPTSWLFAIPFIDADRLTVVLASGVTSLALWGLLGRRLAARSDHWPAWVSRYLTYCGAWIVLNIVLIGLVAALP